MEIIIWLGGHYNKRNCIKGHSIKKLRTTAITPLFRRLKQRNHEFEATLDYI